MMTGRVEEQYCKAFASEKDPKIFAVQVSDTTMLTEALLLAT